MLAQTEYDKEKSKFLINGFRNGFSLNYQGPKICTDESKNIPFTIGDSREMWKKIMKEVRLGRLAGPYTRPPFENYVESPIRLVPKDGGLQTRLIFHLSFDFPSGNSSVNSSTPEELCSVKYNNLDMTIKYCLRMIESERSKTGATPNLYFSKTDLVSTFCVVPVIPQDRWLLILKAHQPLTGDLYFFVDKNLTFGHSISCSLFQKISDSLRYILEATMGQQFVAVNYLDDYRH